MSERDIFLAAIEIADLDQRAAYLDQACGKDVNLRQGVERLLHAEQMAGSFLAHSPVSSAENTPTQPASDELPSARSAMAPIGTRIGPYKLLQKIGEGGMGVVYMAEQLEPIRRKVALKIIKPGMDTELVIARFEAERQALALMDHQNIAKVLDAGETNGLPFFVMELVKGVPITRFSDDNHLTLNERLELFIPACHAVQHAHQKGIIHRDIKPSNVLVALYDGKPIPKIIDFGVAKATSLQLTDRTLFTAFGQMVGTLEYMSPEQAKLDSLDVDSRTDVYALGVLLYELLTGTTPLDRKRMKEAVFTELLRMIREDEPPKPSTRLSSADTLPSIAALRNIDPVKLGRLVRGDLDWIVMKALEKDRARRYDSASGLAQDIAHYLHDEPVLAGPPSARYRFGKFVRRNRRWMVTGAAFLILMLLGTTMSIWQAVRATQAERQADRERDAAIEAQSRAESNLGLARSAVDKYLRKMAEDPALKYRGDSHALRKQLLSAALPFLTEFVAQKTDSTPLRLEQCQTYRMLGFVHGELEEAPEAIAAYEQAAAIAAQLVADHPEDPDYRQKLALCHYSLAIYFRSNGKHDPARKACLAALDLQRQLAVSFASVAAYAGDLADSCNLLGMLAQDHSEWDAALAAFGEAKQIASMVIAADPTLREVRTPLTLAHNNLGIVQKTLGRLEQATGNFQEAVQHGEVLVRQAPFDPNYRDDLASFSNNLANILVSQNKYKEAERIYREALKTQNRLVEEFPTVPGYRQNSAIMQRCLGRALERLKRHADANQVYQNALKEHRKLVADFKNMPIYRQQLAETLDNHAECLHILNRPIEEETAFREALSIREQLFANFSDTPGYAVDLAASCCNLGWLLMNRKQPEAALDWFGKAITLLEPLLLRDERMTTMREYLRNAHWNRAESLMTLGRYKEAPPDWDRALQLDGGSDVLEIRLKRASCWAHTGESAKAVVEVKEVTRDPTLPSERLREAAEILVGCATLAKADLKQAEDQAALAVRLLARIGVEEIARDPSVLAGWKTGPALALLRSRPDFKKLIADREAALKAQPVKTLNQK